MISSAIARFHHHRKFYTMWCVLPHFYHSHGQRREVYLPGWSASMMPKWWRTRKRRRENSCYCRRTDSSLAWSRTQKWCVPCVEWVSTPWTLRHHQSSCWHSSSRNLSSKYTTTLYSVVPLKCEYMICFRVGLCTLSFYFIFAVRRRKCNGW